MTRRRWPPARVPQRRAKLQRGPWRDLAKQRRLAFPPDLRPGDTDIGAKMRIKLGQIGPRAPQRHQVIDVKPQQTRPAGPEPDAVTEIKQAGIGPGANAFVKPGTITGMFTVRDRVARQHSPYHS